MVLREVPGIWERFPLIGFCSIAQLLVAGFVSTRICFLTVYSISPTTFNSYKASARFIIFKCWLLIDFSFCECFFHSFWLRSFF